MRHMRHF